MEILCSQRREGDGGGRGDDGEGDQARGGGGVLGDVGVDRPVVREPARLGGVQQYIVFYVIRENVRAGLGLLASNS